MVARLLRIYGKVQGVYFRDSAIILSTELGVAGWVRNRSDGTVEILLEGEPASVEAFIRWARQGPVAAQVDKLSVIEIGSQGSQGFNKRPTL
ncbi:acylphosphatase [Craterilacuibacter sp.]|uniref:acylphosphatase n=1 Tax=Craterilacuibacter sp. TaxID=2870909 RepID=UPI003F3DB89F